MRLVGETWYAQEYGQEKIKLGCQNYVDSDMCDFDSISCSDSYTDQYGDE